MLHRIPRHIPQLSMMLADLGSPSAVQIAKALGVDKGTAYRWIRNDKAPYPVLLALFWLTRWGVSQVHCEAHNDALRQAQLAACYRAQLEDALAKLDHLGRIGDFGAANDPTPEVLRRAAVLPLLAKLGEPQAAPVEPKKPRKKTASQQRAELAKQRLAKRAADEPKPFDFLRAK